MRASANQSPLRRDVHHQFAAALGLCISAVALAGCSGAITPIQQPQTSVSTTTTRIASADIIGLDRKQPEMCAPPVRGGTAPAKIVAADPRLLDALCALGLQERVVGSTAPAPDYLDPAIRGVAVVNAPVPDAAVYGTPDSTDANIAVGGVTTMIGPAGATWKQTLRALGRATGLPRRAQVVIAEYERVIGIVSQKIDGAHSMISLVRFTAGKAFAEGTAPLSAQVMRDLLIQRPAAQQQRAPVELTGDDFRAADGDLIYVSFDGAGGRADGERIMKSDPWSALRAVVATRQLIVQDSVWYGFGPLAARALVHDIQYSINSDSG